MNDRPDLCLGLLLAPADVGLLDQWLADNAGPFDFLAVLYDGPEVPDAVLDKVRTLAPQPGEAVLVQARSLDRDFAAQRSHLAGMSPCEWVFMLDADEHVEPRLLALLAPALGKLLEERPGLRVVGFPRTNLVDGEPSEETDFQFRLVQRGEPWVNTHPRPGARPGCHELPLACVEDAEDKNKALAVLEAVRITHPKSKERQAEQDAFYGTF